LASSEKASLVAGVLTLGADEKQPASISRRQNMKPDEARRMRHTTEIFSEIGSSTYFSMMITK
jgi:hypothetical protein